jgi:uncharacterized pyridoxamine 5'-phosphate oxidase family protein
MTKQQVVSLLTRATREIAEAESHSKRMLERFPGMKDAYSASDAFNIAWLIVDDIRVELEGETIQNENEATAW